MRINKKLFILSSITFFILAGTIYASSSQFLSQAQKFINANCSKKKILDQTALLCYLFNKVQEQDVTLTNHETKISNLETTITPMPGQIATIQSHQGQDEQQFTILNQQVQALSAKIDVAPTPISWDIRGNYTLQFLTFGESPTAEAVNIITFDTNTGQFSGTGNISSIPTTISGVLNGSQFNLHIQWEINGNIVAQDITGSIAPDGTLWGIGKYSSGAAFFNVYTFSGAATKK